MQDSFAKINTSHLIGKIHETHLAFRYPFQPMVNLIVKSGEAEYYKPTLQEVMQFSE